MPEEEKNLDKEPEDIFAEAEVAPPPKSEVQPPTTPPTPAAPKSGAQLPTKLPTKPTKEKKPINTKKIVKIAIIVIVILVIGFAIFYGVNTLTSQKTSDAVPATGTETGVTPPTEQESPPETLDSDGDGLSDARERELRTNRYSPDSDNDGLFDKEEVDVYKTNPLQSDTDGDGILDGDEVRQGTDPNDATPGALLLDLQKEIEKLK